MGSPGAVCAPIALAKHPALGGVGKEQPVQRHVQEPTGETFLEIPVIVLESQSLCTCRASTIVPVLLEFPIPECHSYDMIFVQLRRV